MRLYGIHRCFHRIDMRIFIAILMLAFAGCMTAPSSDNTTAVDYVNNTVASTGDTVTVFTTPPFEFNYDIQKKRCQQLYQVFKRNQTPESKKKLITFLMDSLVACWYGTPWDYNGISEVPGQGQIACGYYVTTTLRDAGMKINRVKMAQCVEQNLLYDLCNGHKTYSDKPLDHFVKEVEKAGVGLYIVGLDNHTGYLYNDGADIWFVHSGVYPPKCALKEKAINSITLKNSRLRVFGRIMFDR
jgi:hypothetical protein